MAQQADIDAVTIHLPDEAEDFGVNDTIISSWLDAGLTQTKSILSAWRVIAAKTIGVEDVSESGSSRTNRMHDRAVAMIANWQERANAEDALAGDLPPKAHAKLYTSVRV